MFLLDFPYVSDVLKHTIKTYNHPVIATSSARRLVADSNINWISEAEASALLKTNSNQLLYSNSENGLSWIETHLEASDINQHIQSVKDKALFREKTTSLFPDFKFQVIELQDIHNLASDELNFPFVLKPSVGFLSLGVYVVHNKTDWEKAKADVLTESFKGLFPKNVVDTTYFIMEDIAQGEEYAVDYYYDADGDVVILGILHHLFSSGTDTSDRVYITSKAIVDQHKTAFKKFLKTIGDVLGLKNFPAHAELRVDKKGAILPIEINPLRFGGWCTTADLSGLALGLDSYAYFLEQRVPDWDVLFQGKEDKIFSVVVLDNSTGLSPNEIQYFDYDALAADFQKPLCIRQLDINTYPLFGFVFAETDSTNQLELQNILTSDLKKYVVLNE